MNIATEKDLIDFYTKLGLSKEDALEAIGKTEIFQQQQKAVNEDAVTFFMNLGLSRNDALDAAGEKDIPQQDAEYINSMMKYGMSREQAEFENWLFKAERAQQK